MHTKGEVLKYNEDEEHIVRRLGAAIVVQWDNIPEETQDLIKSQAINVFDRYHTVQLAQQINVFIKEKKGISDT
jgi:predicted DNA-binding WGR domain protein